MAEFDNEGFAPALQRYAGEQAAPPGGGGKPAGGGGIPPPAGFGPPDPWAIPGNQEAGGPPSGGTAAGGGTDWSSILGIYGMPPDIASAVGKIFADNPDVNQAVTLALAYIRGTDWYKATYPGIQYGMSNGLTRNEADYRAYVNALRQYYRQYLGRDPTGDEIAGYLQNGTDATIVGKTLEGNAYAEAYKGDIEFYAGNFGTGQLSKADLQAYGQEKVGLGSAGGYKIDQMIQAAIKRYQGAFGGSTAQFAGTGLGPVGLASPGLAGEKESLSKTPDIAAA